jgi:uncharacterized protein YraI
MIPRRLVQRVVVLTLALLQALPAFAFNGQTRAHVNLRSGPGRSFPVVTVLPPRTSVTIFHCNARRWCSVSARRHRGWIYERYLSHMGSRGPQQPPMPGRPRGTETTPTPGTTSPMPETPTPPTTPPTPGT